MQFQLLMRSFAYAVLIASIQAAKLEFKECKIESKDNNAVKVAEPCETKGDSIAMAFEILEEISDDEMINVKINVDGDLLKELNNKLVKTLESEKPYTDYNDECGLNIISPVSTGKRDVNCKIDGSPFEGFENKEFEMYISSNIMDLYVKGKILE